MSTFMAALPWVWTVARVGALGVVTAQVCYRLSHYHDHAEDKS